MLQLQDLIRAAAAQERTDPGEQLRKRKRLHQIVVSATVESVHPIVHGVLGRQDKHGRLEPMLAKRREDLQAVAPRQHRIQNHKIERLVIYEEKPFLPRARDVDVIVLRLEPFTKGLRNLPLVLDDQDTHSTQKYSGPPGAAAPDMNVRDSSVAPTRSKIMIVIGSQDITDAHVTKEAQAMRRTITFALIVYFISAVIPFPALAQPGPATGRETLARELRNTWLPLEGGMTVSRSEGTPISAKYEIDNGTFQLSVYTLQGDRFSEVIVDYSVGTVMKVGVITDSGDLAAAQNQKEIMARATRTLEAATAEVVRTNPGYRAVSAMPGLHDGRPVVEIILVNGTDWRTVFGSLD